jgi:uncharacterized membrane protein
MARASRTVRINRPVTQVFDFFTDVTNEKRWRGEHLKEISISGPFAVGSVVHQEVAAPGGRTIAADYRITEFVPEASYVFDVIAGPARPHGDFRFAPAGPDATDVTFVLSADLGGLKKLLMARPVQKSMDGEVAALDRAKAILEAD